MQSRQKQWFLRYAEYLRPHALIGAVILAGTLLSTLLFHTVPFLFRFLVDQAILPRQPLNVAWFVAAFAAVILVASVLSFFSLKGYVRLREQAEWAVMRDVFEAIEHSTGSGLEERSVGELLATLTGDAERAIDYVFTVFDELLLRAISILYIVGALAFLDWRLAIVTLALLPVIFVVQRRHVRLLQKQSRRLRNEYGSFMDFVQQRLRRIRLAQLFGQEDSEVDSFAKQGRKLLKDTVAVGVTQERISLQATLAGYAILALVLTLGSFLVLGEALSVGTLVAIYGFQLALFPLLRGVVSAIARLEQYEVSLRKVDALLRDLSPPPQPARPRVIRGGVRSVTLDHVTFSYPHLKPAVKHVDFTLHAGRLYCLVGKNGSGKTTILRLLSRLHDPTHGRILANDVPVSEVDLRAWRSRVAYVTSEANLLDLSVRENIRFGRPEATDEEVEAAARRAGVHDVIMQLPRGYETKVHELDVGLSDGQQQRLSIARALIKDAEIFLFDQSTAALDPESEQHILEALHGLRADARVVVVVSHHLSTIEAADEVLVMHDGQLVESGSVSELQKRNGRFSELFRTALLRPLSR